MYNLIKRLIEKKYVKIVKYILEKNNHTKLFKLNRIYDIVI
jgi:hypothetical protein